MFFVYIYVEEDVIFVYDYLDWILSVFFCPPFKYASIINIFDWALYKFG